MDARKGTIGLFDFDGTITRVDSMLPFLFYTLRRHPAGLADLPAISVSLASLVAGRSRLEAAKTELMRLFGRVPEAERAAFLEDFFRKGLERIFLPGALERIAWHRAQGHRLVLASASVDVYLEAVAEHLGFDTLIATRVGAGTRPQVEGRNCWGREKVRRLMAQDWFAEVDWPSSWAYSDSPADLPMLLLCGHPVAVNPKPGLKRHARRQGWPVVDWRKPGSGDPIRTA